MRCNRSWRFAVSRSALAAACLVAFTAIGAAQQGKRGDVDDVDALVTEYSRFEDAGDMQSQSKLMAPERWWHGVGGRRTDNALYMKTQGEQFAANQKRYPGLIAHREVRDLRTRLIAPTVAVSSFTWFVNRVIPADMPSEKVQALGQAPIPVTVSLVWVKLQDGWKIIHSHQSPLYILPAR